MENKNNNSHIKNKLDQHEFEFRPQSWDNMEALLNGKPRKKSYFKTKTILIMTTVFFFLAYLLVQQPAAPPLADFNTPQSVVAKELTTFQKLSTLNPENQIPSSSKTQTTTKNPNKSQQIIGDPQLSTNSQFSILNSQFFKRLAQKLNTHNTHYASEKTYLQFDRTFFEPGEAIWFNAFVRSANSLKINAKSEILYVELLAPNGSITKTVSLRVQNGQAAGDFQLDKTVAGGMYKIRAYTNWQLNTDDAFERDIQVQATVLPRLRMEMDF